MSGATVTHAAIDAVWRIECAKVVATVARLTRDIGLAEECAQDALVSALEHWPGSGVPANPAEWLVTAARNRALDAARADTIGDDLLRLMFCACHPVLPADARVALTLRMLGGLSTAEIAHAFLLPEATIAQRIVRAKKTLTAAQVPFDLPIRHDGAALGERLGTVLEVLYLIFNEGYAASSGSSWMRTGLCDEALRLARVLATLAADGPEVHGLLALMELQASRTNASTDAAGRPVLLADQDRSRWDHLLIRRGLNALARAETMSFAPRSGSDAVTAVGPGPYTLQAALAACHARAADVAATDWPRIVALYDALLAQLPTPVVALNRAVAVGMAHGPAAGLAAADALAGEPVLTRFHWLPSVRGDLLARLGRHAEASAQFEAAAALTGNACEQELLLRRASQCRAQPPTGARGGCTR